MKLRRRGYDEPDGYGPVRCEVCLFDNSEMLVSGTTADADADADAGVDDVAVRPAGVAPTAAGVWLFRSAATRQPAIDDLCEVRRNGRAARSCAGSELEAGKWRTHVMRPSTISPSQSGCGSPQPTTQ